MARWYPLILVALLASCQSSNSTGRISELERQVEALRKEVASLNSVVEEHGIDLAIAKLDKQHSALLSLADTGSSPLPTDAGTLWVRMVDVEAVGASSRVTLTFGNTGAATLSKVSMNLRWRKTNADDLSEPKFIDQVVTMAPGSWSRMKIVIDTPPASIGQLAISDLFVSQVGLLGKV